VTKEAIQKVGEQGGDLYDIAPRTVPRSVACDDTDPPAGPPNPQRCLWMPRTFASPNGVNGLDHLDFTDAAGKQYRVSYGITRHKYQSPQIYAFDENTYPKSGFEFATMTGNTPYFGDLTLRKLCDRWGPNRPDAGKLALPCTPASYDTVRPEYPSLATFSVQEQMAFYIKSNMGSCAKFSQYMKRGYAFTVGEPNVSVILSNTEVTALVDYSINISGPRNMSANQSMRFQTSVSSSMKKVFEYAYFILDKDTKDLNFDLSPTSSTTADYKNDDFTKGGFTYERINDVGGSCPLIAVGPKIVSPADSCRFDDVIIIKSPDFKLQFAVANRRPALDKITAPNSFAIGAETIPIAAVDPDDTALTFEPEGYGFTVASFESTDICPNGYEFYVTGTQTSVGLLTVDPGLTFRNKYPANVISQLSVNTLNTVPGVVTVIVHDEDVQSRDSEDFSVACCSGGYSWVSDATLCVPP
jgi:hypothetical protein